MDVSVIMPALNEEKNILPAIEAVLQSFAEYDITGEILVIDDGSTDKTCELVESKIKEDARVKLFTHRKNMGIGASFWDGVDNACANSVTMIPGDNENAPGGILQHLDLLKKYDMIVPFPVNKNTRSGFRGFISCLYGIIIRRTFGINFKYTNGTVLYKKSVLHSLKHRGAGFSYQADILVRLARQGCRFIQVPYSLRRREGGLSKAISLKVLYSVVKDYFRLIRDIYFNYAH